MTAPNQPFSADAEQGLLAACLLYGDGEVLNECLAANLRPEYFYDPKHQLIFESMMRLSASGVPPDELLLADRLDGMGRDIPGGWRAFLVDLSSRIQTNLNWRHWMGVVRDKFFLRQLIRASQWTVEQAQAAGSGVDVPELLDRVEAEFFKIQNDTLPDDDISTPALVDAVQANITKQLSRKGELSGLTTGLTDLDRILGGLKPAEMIVLAARPSIGKSAYAGNIAQELVLPSRPNQTPVPTLIFSIEMSAEQMMHRLACGHARVDMMRLMDGFCDRQPELINSCRLLKLAPIKIDAAPSPTIYQLRAKARRHQRKSGIKLIIVDYLQLIRPAVRGGTREQEVAEISRGIKAMARELSVPVLVLAQLNRAADKDNRRPRLSDLRESGQIEADADVVLLLCKGDESEDETPDQPSVRRQIIIAKNRNGPIGEISTTFNRRLCLFQNYTGQQY